MIDSCSIVFPASKDFNKFPTSSSGHGLPALVGRPLCRLNLFCSLSNAEIAKNNALMVCGF
jgi:hypothetical protein